MPPDKIDQPIKITLDDLASIETAVPTVAVPAASSSAGQGRVYGNIGDTTEEKIQTPEERGSIFLQAWFYLGLAGFLGCLIGWAIAEPAFIDGDGRR